MLKTITSDTNGTNPEINQCLDDLAREGAHRMIVAALELEVEEYLSRARHLRDEQGHAAAIRNGKARERTILMGVGSIRVRAPRLHDRREGERFTSKPAKRATVHAAITTLGRSSAGTLPARPINGRLFRRTRGVAGTQSSRPLSDHHQPASQRVAGRVSSLAQMLTQGQGVRVHLGGRSVLLVAAL